MKTMFKGLRRLAFFFFAIAIPINLGVIGAQHLRGHPPLPDFQGLIKSTGTKSHDRNGPPINNVVNFRDVGGYLTTNEKRVRKGLVYRSGDLSNLQEDGTGTIEELGIKTIVDLRTPGEQQSKPDVSLTGIDFIPLPIYEDSEEPGGFWRALTRYNLEEYWDDYNLHFLVEEKAPRYGELFTRLANGNEPTLIHCTAGKDRVGIGVVLLLLTLGVSAESIVYDYTYSNKYFPEILGHAQDRYDEHKFFTTLFNMKAIDLQTFYLAREETVQKILGHIADNYSTIDAYLIKRAGMDAHTIELLRDRFIEELDY